MSLALRRITQAFYMAGGLMSNQEPDEISVEIREMLADPKNPCRKQYPQETYEEFSIHDYEGFGEIKVSEWHDIEEISKLANLIVENNSEIVSAAFDHVNGVDDIEEFIQDNFCGTYPSLAHLRQFKKLKGLSRGCPKNPNFAN